MSNVMSINIVREFSAMHVLRDVEKCSRLHGHNYRVEVSIQGDVNAETGMIANFDDIKAVVDVFDHRLIVDKRDAVSRTEKEHVVNLNHMTYTVPAGDVVEISGEATAENISLEIARRIKKRISSVGHIHIKLWETSNSFVDLIYS